MKLWNFEEIEKKGQDAVDIEVLQVANQFMRDGNLLAHPLHEEGESDLGLWKALFREYHTQRKYVGESVQVPTASPMSVSFHF